MYVKTSDLSDITLVRFRFQCQLGYKPSRFLNLVEIEREKYYTRLLYFADIKFIAIRLVIYEPRKVSQIKHLDRAVPLHVEIYMFSQ